jgi:GntR family transcriptional regulator of vanillate catabolism
MSQTVAALLGLRELILSGEVQPGERLSEVLVAQRLNVSRTPVRLALVRLEQEGLLEEIPSGGYAVRAFSETEMLDAIEVRGVLEGTAARLAAERGVTAVMLSAMAQAIDAMDEHAHDIYAHAAAFTAYVERNEHFHRLIARAAGSALLERQLIRIAALPFASPSAFLDEQARLPLVHVITTAAQEHHRAILEALGDREGTRAEALMREHSRLAARHLKNTLRARTAKTYICAKSGQPQGALIGSL